MGLPHGSCCGSKAAPSQQALPPSILVKRKTRNGIALVVCFRRRIWIISGCGICRRGAAPSRVVLRRAVLRRQVQRFGGRGICAEQGRFGGRDRCCPALSQWCPVAEYSDRSGNELKVILRTRHRRAHGVLCGRPASAAGPRVTRSDVGFWGRRPFDSPWWRAIDHRQPYRWALIRR
jgi:hypothetical protein